MEGHALVGRALYLGDFSWDFYYHVISDYIVLSSHGGKAYGMAGIFGLSVEITVPSRWKGRSLLCCSWVKALWKACQLCHLLCTSSRAKSSGTLLGSPCLRDFSMPVRLNTSRGE